MNASRHLIRLSGRCIAAKSSLHRVTPTLAVCHKWLAVRRQSTEALASPLVEGEEKNYPPKIQKIVHEISQLTLIEVADLNELLKKTLNIADAPMMMGAMPAGPVKKEEEEAEVKVEKVDFTVKLMKFDEKKKVAIIKELKNLMTDMNLVQAKKFVEACPQPVKTDIPKEEAETLKAALEAVGGVVEIE